MKKKYDFGGWATKANLKCADGLTILSDAFKEDDGKTVPLVWNHIHDNPERVLGHALLENREDGVYAYCTFNDSDAGQASYALVRHGDVVSLSIFANQLTKNGNDVIHGKIREVSLVLAGSNPGALIEPLELGHSITSSCGVQIFNDEEGLEFFHSDTEEDVDVKEKQESAESEEENESKDSNKTDLEHSDDKEEKDKNKTEEKTIKQVYDTLNEEQKTAVDAIVGIAVEEAVSDKTKTKPEEKKEDKESMKHNLFENENRDTNVLSHSDMMKIFSDAKRLGSLKEAVLEHMENGVLAHSIDTTGMDTAKGTQTYGINDMSMLYPDYKTLNMPPEFISRDMTWVDDVLSSVHTTPFSRIRSLYANITEDDARAKGYIKGKQKKEEVFTTLKRTTDPQTVYKKQKLDRDDIIDITDFDVVAWLKKEMDLMLREELARAILIGDGRAIDSDDKIKEDHIRPIAKDVPLFNTKVKVSVDEGDDEQAVAKKTINAIIKARKKYKGSGNPTFYTTEDVVTDMLLIEDTTGRKIYQTEEQLATALRVKKIVTVEPMEGQQVDELDLLGIIVNLKDYNKGADKGGEKALFDDFDIDYNQYKYLMETRMSGALVKPFAALTILKDKKNF